MMMPDSFPERTTGADGRFAFQGLTAGDYTLTARRPGYARVTVDPVKVGEDGAEPVYLVLAPDDRGEYLAPVANDGRSEVITRGFDTEDERHGG